MILSSTVSIFVGFSAKENPYVVILAQKGFDCSPFKDSQVNFVLNLKRGNLTARLCV